MEYTTGLQLLATVLRVGVESILQDQSFTTNGGDSMAALRFCMECKRNDIFVPVDRVLSSGSVTELLRQCRPVSVYKNGKHPQIRTGHDASIRDNEPTRPREHFREVGSRSRLDEKPALWRENRNESSLRNAIDESLESNAGGLRPILTFTDEFCTGNHTVCDMSDIQISLVHGSLESPGANIIYYSEIHNPSHIFRLREAWMKVCRAEPIFQTAYRIPDDGQEIRPRLCWREFKTKSRTAYRNALLQATGPGMPWPDNNGVDFGLRFTVLHYRTRRPADSKAAVIWAIHHALIDGWSAGLLVQKVHQMASGKPVSAHPGQAYVDLCRFQQELRLSRKAEGDLFWAEQSIKLATACDELLIAKAPNAPAFTNNVWGKRDEMQVPVELAPTDHAAVKVAAQSCGVTPAAFFYAAWAVCLGLYASSDSVVIGAVVSGRNIGLAGIFDTIGPMVNTLPLQVDLDWQSSSRKLVEDVFARIKRLSYFSWTTPNNGFSRVRGNLMAFTPNPESWVKGAGVEQSFYRHTTNLPLNAIVKEDGGGMVIQYSAERYTKKAMETLASIFRASLLSLSRTEASLESLQPVLQTCGRSLGLMGNWKSFETTVPSVRDDLVTLFEDISTHYPGAIAVECGDQTITYCELERLSGCVASKLIQVIQPQEVVAVHADGSVNWVVSIYGILRAGGIYCPLDRSHPQRYRESLFKASTARVFLSTDKRSMASIPAAAEIVINVAAAVEDVEATLCYDFHFPMRTAPRPADKAYLCFTSGSTGKPKGVICTHRGLVAFQRNLEVRLGASVGVRIAQVMSLAFDGAIHELFSALSYGATLVLRETDSPASVHHLYAVDCAILTPSLASVLDPDDFPQLRTVYLVGEIVPQTVCDTWASSKTVYNMYGPTEATCGATIKQLRPGQTVTIGKPNPTTRIYILDKCKRLAPPGVVGDIYLAGVQVAIGYIGQPEVTAERFLPDPFMKSGESMYQTGDRGYWDDSGDIIFLGRADRQTKLQGFRVDLEDLEARILRACGQQHGASAVAVTTQGDQLICMIQTNSGDLAGMRTAIRDALPPFAIPKHTLVTRQLPMTSNMKVDYRTIVQLVNDSSICHPNRPETNEISSTTRTEAVVAAIWAQILENEALSPRIGPDSNFIQLGGHSLQQLRLAAKLKSVFGVLITLRMIMNIPTLREFAAAIDKMDKMSLPPMAAEGRNDAWLGAFDPRPIEREWWRKYQLRFGTSAFNVSWVAQYSASIDGPKLANAWNAVLARHLIFRSRYVQHDGFGLQRVLSLSPPRVNRRRRLNIRRELNRNFDLSTSPPVRVTMTHNAIIAIWSHIVCDYTTLGIVLKEVATEYHRGPLVPPPSPKSPPEVCGRQISSDESCVAFWSAYLDGVKNKRHPYLGNDIERVDYQGKSLVGRVSVSLWHRMQACVRECRVTLQQLLIAAVAAAVTIEDEKIDVTLGAPFLNRHSEADMEAVGLFLEPLPVRVHHVDTTSTLRSYLHTVQDSSQGALAHAVPWDQLLEYLGIDSGSRIPNHPIFDCVTSFHDARCNGSNNTQQSRCSPWDKAVWGDGVEPQLVWSDGAKFKLMVECLAYDDDTLIIRLEYDTACFEGSHRIYDARIKAVRRMILTAMTMIVSPENGTVGGLRQGLGRLWEIEKRPGVKSVPSVDLLHPSQGLFMRRFSDLNIR
ncbi:nonribosomal peptide synthase [Colletotrichum chrysophilum]|uniref:Nonribosomal peptide synthase n=1 Tax=Colletotrichum chrysophilum TaxID=1836956 RepID=A0AAD9EIH0_9PEZI|nr:nonribosomal peptide synthase [Colletotrichum chrysophilum]